MRTQTQSCQPFSRYDPQEKEKSQNIPYSVESININNLYNYVITLYRNYD